MKVRLGAHLTASHIFGFVFNYNFLKKVILLSCRLFSSSFLLSSLLNWLLAILLTVQVVEIDFVVVLVFKGVQGAIRPFFEQELRQIWRWDKVVLFDFVAHCSFLAVVALIHVVDCILMRFVIPSQTACLLGHSLRFLSGMQRVPYLLWLLLIASSLVLLLNLMLSGNLFHGQLLTYLLLRGAFSCVVRDFGFQVVFAVVNCILAVCQSVHCWLDILHFWSWLLRSILICASDTSSRFWWFTSAEISSLGLVSVEGWEIVFELRLLLELQNIVSFDESFYLRLSNIIKPAASQTIYCSEAFCWIQCQHTLE